MHAVIVAVPDAHGAMLPISARVAGLPVLLRAALAFASRGATRLLVVHRPEDAAAAAFALTDARLSVPVELVPVAAIGSVPALLAARLSSAASSGDAASRCDAASRSELAEPFLFARHDCIVDPGLYARVAAVDADGCRAPSSRVVVDGGVALGVARLTLSALELVGANGELAALARQGGVEQLELAPSWAVDARTLAGRREAVRRLFLACRKPVDGVVSRHLNRYVSLFISRQLVETRVTPNAMTAFTFSLAIAAAVFAARGGYVSVLAAAVLMQLNSILDGCDGELARVRYQGSKVGQWLDTVGDDASNVLFWAALGYGARSEAHGEWLAAAGYASSAANALAAALNYVLLARLGSGDFYALTEGAPARRAGIQGGVVRALELILKQDFFKLLLVALALLGVLEQALAVFVVGALITLGSSLARFLRRYRMKT